MTEDPSRVPPPLPSYDPQRPAPPLTPDPAADPALRAAALKHLEAVKAFRIHLTVYLAVMALLVAIWLITGAGYFWPVWPAMGWGLGLGLHRASMSWDREPTEAQIAEQARRLAQRRDQDRPRAIED
ncbi:2TM domain-containing protein [Ornithinimicrobium tianjinense]|nr:2TM domain-containing protein [Ornithinimicrobium tianjinense]